MTDRTTTSPQSSQSSHAIDSDAAKLALSEVRAARPSAADDAQADAMPPATRKEHREQTQRATEDAHEDHEEHAAALTWPEGLRILVVALAAAVVGFHVWEPFTSVSVVGVIGLLVGGWPIAQEAFENLRARRMTMELSMTIAILAAALIGQFFTALVITLFVLVAEVLEGLTVSRGRRAIRELLDVLPQTVTVRRDGRILEVAADHLVVGDAVLVNPGGRIPVDGTVLAGHSFVDQSRITGESLPVEKVAGAPCMPARSISRVHSSCGPSTSAATRASARSSRRSNAPSTPAPPSSGSPTDWPRTSSTLRSPPPPSRSW